MRPASTVDPPELRRLEGRQAKLATDTAILKEAIDPMTAETASALNGRASAEPKAAGSEV